jgi:hypothetical protein
VAATSYLDGSAALGTNCMTMKLGVETVGRQGELNSERVGEESLSNVRGLRGRHRKQEDDLA